MTASYLERAKKLVESEHHRLAPYAARDLLLLAIAEELVRIRTELERGTKASGHIARAISATAAKIADEIRRRR